MTETPIICVWPQPPGGLKSTFPSDQKKETIQVPSQQRHFLLRNYAEHEQPSGESGQTRSCHPLSSNFQLQ